MEILTSKEQFIEIIKDLDTFEVKTYGRIYWDVYDIEVETGLIRLDVMGKLDIIHCDDVTKFRVNGIVYDNDFDWFG